MINSGYTNRHDVTQLIQSGQIATTDVDKALHVSNITPSNHAWENFVSNLLLMLGVVALSSALMFFLAYNWDDLGRFAKFGLAEAFVALSVLGYWWSNRKTADSDKQTALGTPQKYNLTGKAALLAASLGLGVLLAFYGQTYQTGADTWQLFFTWAVLIIPWTLIANFPALWLVLLALLNLSAILYISTFGGIFGIPFSSEINILWLLAGINGIALIKTELLKGRFTWLDEGWATAVLAFSAGLPITLLVIESIFDRFQSSAVSLLIWAAAMGAIYIVYRKLRPNVLILAMACVSGIAVILSLVGKTLFSHRPDMGAFLLMAILVIALGGSAAVWLKKVHKEQHV